MWPVLILECSGDHYLQGFYKSAAGSPTSVRDYRFILDLVYFNTNAYLPNKITDKTREKGTNAIV